ncbi:hypothetical protein AJ78_01358 [Emergomyces pasteurianus Ep9510]|uniref:Uncharacterized protein n=1 Tax=Emergomyces pasteurianus Ep9510 TaxID=1447872 RepID=A0A1J9PR20_9EURO|nr:hypothetical protein AJ78_01358 [Emergomyces pasteurianus Ep9510]
MPEPQNHRPGDDSVSWPEIFSQHESNLNRHLDICGMVKQHVVPESPSSRAISSMVDRTQELLRQLENLRIEFMPQHTATRILSGKSMNRVNEQRACNKDAEPVCQGPSTSQPATQSGNNQHPRDGPSASGASTPPFVFDKRPFPVSLPQHPRSTNKRSLDDDSRARDNGEVTVVLSARKRKKLYSTEHGEAVNSDNMPTGSSTRFVETEDISAEVEARLKAKEENRRRRAEKQERKRKRNSAGSTSGVPGAEISSQPRAKRSKAHPAAERDKPPVTGPANGGVRKQEKRRIVADAYENVKENGEGNNGKVYKKAKKSRS